MCYRQSKDDFRSTGGCASITCKCYPILYQGSQHPQTLILIAVGVVMVPLYSKYKEDNGINDSLKSNRSCEKANYHVYNTVTNFVILL